MPKLKKSKIEFYITNVCNFNCDNCNRLNNYRFSGQSLWKDCEDLYKKWGTLIDFEKITILGGEPLLNTSLDQWLLGTRSIWPNATIQLLTNGSRLKYWYQRGLFDILSSTKTELHITLHNRTRRQEVIAEILSYLTLPELKVMPNSLVNWADAYNAVKDPAWPVCESYDDFDQLPGWIQQECTEIHGIDFNNWCHQTGITHIHDANNDINVFINYAENFVTAPLKYVGENKFAVYASDPDQAHNVCISKTCTHMMDGKIYKCHHVALLPEFLKQFNVDITDKDYQLLTAYQPLSVDDDQSTMQHFLDNVNNVIPQCKLCPSSLEAVFLHSTTDKPKTRKNIPIKSNK